MFIIIISACALLRIENDWNCLNTGVIWEMVIT